MAREPVLYPQPMLAALLWPPVSQLMTKFTPEEKGSIFIDRYDDQPELTGNIFVTL